MLCSSMIEALGEKRLGVSSTQDSDGTKTNKHQGSDKHRRTVTDGDREAWAMMGQSQQSDRFECMVFSCFLQV